jgi:exosome complex component RRP42
MVEILDEVKKAFVKDLVANGKRPSGRQADEYRKIVLEKGVIPNAEGSARVHLGKTQVLVGVKLGIGTPFADRPDEGVLSTNSELLQLAHPTFEGGPPNADSVELARVVDRGIRSAGIIDLKKLFIEEGKAWNVFIDIYSLDQDGNLIDAAALAAMAALSGTRMTKFEDGKPVFGEYSGLLPVSGKCVCSTFAKVSGAILADPDLDEETAMDARLTVCTMGDKICAMQKGSTGGFTSAEVEQVLDRSFVKGAELAALI